MSRATAQPMPSTAPADLSEQLGLTDVGIAGGRPELWTPASGVLTVNGARHAVEPDSSVSIPGNAAHGIRTVGASPLRFLDTFPADSPSDVEYEWLGKAAGPSSKVASRPTGRSPHSTRRVRRARRWRQRGEPGVGSVGQQE